MPKHKPSSSSQSGEPKSKKARTKSSRSDRDDNDEGEEEELTNQSQKPDFTPPLEENEAEYGIIEKISVKNFMCHGRLECNFGPNVNFVVGRNGSGKSAILTAIVVGLGGKAFATSRGNSVKKFVKAGKNVAEVCIKLRNRGTDAYKPDVYGPSITVMRKITREGGSSYRIMSAKDRVISNKWDELSHIMDHFNIQVDNPVSIMNQETSKNFLLKQSAKDKYKFFLKATQLDQVSNDYREIMLNKRMTEEKVNAQSAKLDTIHEDQYKLRNNMRSYIALKTKYFFIAMMSTRGYVGQLIFDHRKEELILKVDPGESQKAKDAFKDLRSLSGGEISFSTVCLIMALWESVESPFRAMDEFGVSMDMMNRKLCIELLLKFAEGHPNRQFIFLTPQDMSKITPKPSVRIIQLPNPERN